MTQEERYAFADAHDIPMCRECMGECTNPYRDDDDPFAVKSDVPGWGICGCGHTLAYDPRLTKLMEAKYAPVPQKPVAPTLFNQGGS